MTERGALPLPPSLAPPGGEKERGWNSNAAHGVPEQRQQEQRKQQRHAAMYSDLFEHLGGGGLSRAAANAAASSPPEDPRLVAFKAGKIRLSATDRGTYLCEADPTRGEVRLVASADGSRLEWQWYDRRDERVVDRRVVEPVPAVAASSASAGEGKEADESEGEQAQDEPSSSSSSSAAWTFRRIDPPLPARTHPDDRVYVLTRPPPDGGPGTEHDRYDLYWMQDADASHDDELVDKVNRYLSDPAKAVSEATGGGGGAAGSASGGSAARSGAPSATAAAAPSSSASASAQVDALSTILENLGMPQSSSSEAPSPGGGGAPAPGASTAPRNTLTLADLQGAMAGIQQSQQQSRAPTISLTDVVTPDAVSAILEDAAARERLMELLPEGQRSPEFLEENLRSPQVRQTLRLLTQAILPDDDGRVDGFLSVLANFQLPDGGGDPTALLTQASTNPVQAFLDAVVRSVQKEEGGEAVGEAEASAPGGDAMDHENTEGDETKEQPNE